MRFEETGIEGNVINFHVLEQMMDEAGLVRGGQWDWDRTTYDFKFENKNNGEVYYLRIPGETVKGDIERADADIRLGIPYVGRHFYPHGVEYDVEIPEHVTRICKERLNVVKELIQSHTEVKSK